MHDIFEGTCHYIFAESLLYFINTMKYFDLHTLNVRLETFCYNYNDKGSEKKHISPKELENRKLKFSASQMILFCHYFTFIFGDLIPYPDEVWKFILTFIDLIDDLICYEVSSALLLQTEKKSWLSKSI